MPNDTPNDTPNDNTPHYHFEILVEPRCDDCQKVINFMETHQYPCVVRRHDTMAQKTLELYYTRFKQMPPSAHPLVLLCSESRLKTEYIAIQSLEALTDLLDTA